MAHVSCSTHDYSQCTFLLVVSLTLVVENFLICLTFTSVVFTFVVVAFTCFHFNKCHFHVIFILSCVSFTFFNSLHVLFALFSYFLKCCLLAWEVSHITKSGVMVHFKRKIWFNWVLFIIYSYIISISKVSCTIKQVFSISCKSAY